MPLSKRLKIAMYKIKTLTGVGAIAGCLTDLLPEKAAPDDPNSMIKSIQSRLKNTNNLEEHTRAVTDAVRVARSHPKLLKPHLKLINRKIVCFINCQRMAYVRLACQAAGELFRTMRWTDQPIFDDTVTGLMHRTADKNLNIRIDANLALDKMVGGVPPTVAVRSVANCCRHKSPEVKIAMLRVMHGATVVSGAMRVLTDPELKRARQSILKGCVVTIQDASSEVRWMSKKLLQVLKSTCHESFCTALVQDISWDELQIAEKNLNMDGLSAVLDNKVKRSVLL